jgi:hypothetical protein
VDVFVALGCGKSSCKSDIPDNTPKKRLQDRLVGAGVFEIKKQHS